MVSVSKVVKVPGCLCPLLQEYRIPQSKNGREEKTNINSTSVLRRIDIFQRKCSVFEEQEQGGAERGKK